MIRFAGRIAEAAAGLKNNFILSSPTSRGILPVSYFQSPPMNQNWPKVFLERMNMA